ncbi:hypothetical protein PT2222_90310 [Paraburkholderia tropica]
MDDLIRIVPASLLLNVAPSWRAFARPRTNSRHRNANAVHEHRADGASTLAPSLAHTLL